MNSYKIRLRRSRIAAKYVLCVMSCISAAFITASNAEKGSKLATVNFAEKVADGRPWNVHVVERAEKMKMTLFPDGSGVTDALIAPTPKWRPIADGLCLKPSAMIREHCVTLIVRPNGYDGIEDGKLYFELRR